MNNTALRAEVLSADNTHMVFANNEHERFYYEKLEQARYQDCEHKALIYVLGISEDTRNQQKEHCGNVHNWLWNHG
ncbi:MAG: DUF6075 family protein [Lachnospiraceae bacterium]|nr:DUF6075 family protein [Lachnospiraceae bacterium]